MLIWTCIKGLCRDREACTCDGRKIVILAALGLMNAIGTAATGMCEIGLQQEILRRGDLGLRLRRSRIKTA
jgi:hypothetical protein